MKRPDCSHLFSIKRFKLINQAILTRFSLMGTVSKLLRTGRIDVDVFVTSNGDKIKARSHPPFRCRIRGVCSSISIISAFPSYLLWYFTSDTCTYTYHTRHMPLFTDQCFSLAARNILYTAPTVSLLRHISYIGAGYHTESCIASKNKGHHPKEHQISLSIECFKY